MEGFGGNAETYQAGIYWEAHWREFTLKIEQDFEDLMDWEDELRDFLRLLKLSKSTPTLQGLPPNWTFQQIFNV